MEAEIKNWLAFAKQKTVEVALLAKVGNFLNAEFPTYFLNNEFRFILINILLSSS